MSTPPGDEVFVMAGYGGRRLTLRATEALEESFDIQDRWYDPGGNHEELYRGLCYGDGLFVATGTKKRGAWGAFFDV